MSRTRGEHGGAKVREGTVVSDKMTKTVLVAVQANFRHPLYKKTVRRVRRMVAHDEREDARLGDRVRIVEASPISRRKRWRVVEVLTRVELPEVAAESIDLDLLGEVKREVEEVPAAVAAAALEPEIVAEPEPSEPAQDLVEEVEVEEAPETLAEAPGVDEETAPEPEVSAEEAAPVGDAVDTAEVEVGEDSVEETGDPEPEPEALTGEEASPSSETTDAAEAEVEVPVEAAVEAAVEDSEEEPA